MEVKRLAAVTFASFKHPVRRRPPTLSSFLVLVLWSCGRLSCFLFFTFSGFFFLLLLFNRRQIPAPPLPGIGSFESG